MGSFLLLLVLSNWNSSGSSAKTGMNLGIYDTLPMALFNYLHVMGGSISWIALALARSRLIHFLWIVNLKNLLDDTPKCISKDSFSLYIAYSYEDLLRIILHS